MRGLRKPKRIIRALILLTLLLVASCLIWGFFIEPNRLVVHQATIQIENWPSELSGLRSALIGDIHTGEPVINDEKLRRIVELTNQENPDLIVLLGDYMSPNSWHSHRVEPEVTAAAMKNLHAPLGVYAILGNHDWWYNGAKVRRAFEQAGIPVLDDEVTEITWHGQSILLARLPDLWTQPPPLPEPISHTPPRPTPPA